MNFSIVQSLLFDRPASLYLSELLATGRYKRRILILRGRQLFMKTLQPYLVSDISQNCVTFQCCHFLGILVQFDFGLDVASEGRLKPALQSRHLFLSSLQLLLQAMGRLHPTRGIQAEPESSQSGYHGPCFFVVASTGCLDASWHATPR